MRGYVGILLCLFRGGSIHNTPLLHASLLLTRSSAHAIDCTLLTLFVRSRHMSEKRNYVHGPDTVLGNYAAVVPIASLS